MTAKDNYSFEPVGTVDPSAPIVEAVPPTTLESNNAEESERPSDTAIMVGLRYQRSLPLLSLGRRCKSR